MTGQLAADFAAPGSNIYDLGCATGTTLALMDSCVSADVTLIGVDNSAEMLDKCREKLELAKIGKPYQLI